MGTIGTKISDSLKAGICTRRLITTIGEKSITMTAVSGTMHHVLSLGFRVKLFSSPFMSRGRTMRLITSSRRAKLTHRMTHRSVILLGGGSGLLPLGGSVHALTIVNPGTSGICGVLKSCATPRTSKAMIAILSKVQRGISGRAHILCTGKYTIHSSSHAKFGSTVRATHGTSTMMVIVKKSDTQSFSSRCRRANTTGIAVGRVDSVRDNRNCSQTALRLVKERLRLLRRVSELNGPIMLMLVGKHPLLVRKTVRRTRTVIST